MIHSFDVEVAEQYGVNAAILLESLSYWIKKNKANEANYKNGNYWTYNSIAAYKELFPYMSERQIRYELKKLEDEGLIEVANLNENPYNRTKWYALTEKGQLIYPLSRDKSDDIDLSKMSNVHSAELSNVHSAELSNVYSTVNNTINNTINNKEIYKEKKSFSPPTLDEVEEYAQSRNSCVDAKRFYDYFTAGKWIDSKGNHVKNWKQKLITWESMNASKQENERPKPNIGEIL